MKIFTELIDSLKVGQEKSFKSYFRNASAESAIAMMSKLQHNIMTNEMKMVTFCNEHVNCMIDWITNLNYPFAIQSSKILMPNEMIEITAGLTSFVNNRPPEVYINKKLIPLNEFGAAVYKIKVSSKADRYSVPVIINYTDQDGKQQTITKEIEYTVANIQQQ